MSLRHRLGAFAHLLGRYSQTFIFFWRRRHEMQGHVYTDEEAEFLPGRLALQEKPVSPTGLWTARVLITLVVVLLIWAIWGTMDIVVNAQGRVVLKGNAKTIASVETSKVSAIYVQEGQSVRAGEPLIELDTRLILAERNKAEAEISTARLQKAGAQALISAMMSGTAPALVRPHGVSDTSYQDAVAHIQGQYQDLITKLRKFDAETQQYTNSLHIAEKVANDYQTLENQGLVSSHAALEKQQLLIDLRGKLSDARLQREALLTETKKSALETIRESDRIITGLTEDTRRADAHEHLLRIASPVDGSIQQLAVHTIGGVVQAAQPLMVVVPESGEIEVEAMVENKDIGFVHEGQSATVKVEAYEYTKYGTLTGEVVNISRDAIQDEKRGLLYSVRIRLQENILVNGGREYKVTSGMATTVEIKTGNRRVIEYVLSPLLQHANETLKER